MAQLIGFLLLLVSSTVSLAGVISVAGPSAPVAVSDMFTVNIQGMSIVDLYAFQIDLTFDTNLLAANATSQGSLFAGNGGFLPGIIDNAGGMITFIADTLSGLVPGVTGNGTLATITFTALASGISPITLFDIITLDSNLANISETVENGAVILATQTPLPEPPAVILFCTGLLAYLGRKRLVMSS